MIDLLMSSLTGDVVLMTFTLISMFAVSSLVVAVLWAIVDDLADRGIHRSTWRRRSRRRDRFDTHSITMEILGSGRAAKGGTGAGRHHVAA